VEPEGPIVGSADQMVGIFSLDDTEWASHDVNKAHRVPRCSDTGITSGRRGACGLPGLRVGDGEHGRSGDRHGDGVTRGHGLAIGRGGEEGQTRGNGDAVLR
jgi:hypothetical protein